MALLWPRCDVRARSPFATMVEMLQKLVVYGAPIVDSGPHPHDGQGVATTSGALRLLHAINRAADCRWIVDLASRSTLDAPGVRTWFHVVRPLSYVVVVVLLVAAVVEAVVVADGEGKEKRQRAKLARCVSEAKHRSSAFAFVRWVPCPRHSSLIHTISLFIKPRVNATCLVEWPAAQSTQPM